jgi:hypothetical protein
MKFIQQLKNEAGLSHRLSFDAVLLVDLEVVREKMGAYPGIKLVSYGSSLRYSFENVAEDGSFIIISLLDNSISLDIFSPGDPDALEKIAILRLLSVASVLHDCYKVYLDGMFSILVKILSEDMNRINGCKRCLTQEKKKYRREIDIVLAKRIIGIRKERVELENKIETDRKHIEKLVGIIILSKHNGSSPDEIIKDLGISKALLDLAIANLSRNGYKRVELGNGRFQMVMR